MIQHLRAVAVLNIAFASVITPIVTMAHYSVPAKTGGASSKGGDLIGAFVEVMLLGVLSIIVVVGTLMIVGSIGLLLRRRWGRFVLIGTSIILIMGSLPGSLYALANVSGTGLLCSFAIGGYTLIILLNRKTHVMFSPQGEE